MSQQIRYLDDTRLSDLVGLGRHEMSQCHMPYSLKPIAMIALSSLDFLYGGLLTRPAIKRHWLQNLMLGHLSGAMLESTNSTSPTSPERLRLIKSVLEHIQTNLLNIKNTWGIDSPQYQAATEIMEDYLDTNMKRIQIEKPTLEDLMQNMSLRNA